MQCSLQGGILCHCLRAAICGLTSTPLLQTKSGGDSDAARRRVLASLEGKESQLETGLKVGALWYRLHFGFLGHVCNADACFAYPLWSWQRSAR